MTKRAWLESVPIAALVGLVSCATMSTQLAQPIVDENENMYEAVFREVIDKKVAVLGTTDVLCLGLPNGKVLSSEAIARLGSIRVTRKTDCSLSTDGYGGAHDRAGNPAMFIDIRQPPDCSNRYCRVVVEYYRGNEICGARWFRYVLTPQSGGWLAEFVEEM